jgi:L-threonylcarbamoyladenylate synthase
VQDLCLQFGKPITSTSANLSGKPACITFEEVQAQLGDKEVTILKGVTGGRANPSEIRDARSLQLVRKG